MKRIKQLINRTNDETGQAYAWGGGGLVTVLLVVLLLILIF